MEEQSNLQREIKRSAKCLAELTCIIHESLHDAEKLRSERDDAIDRLARLVSAIDGGTHVDVEYELQNARLFLEGIRDAHTPDRRESRG